MEICLILNKLGVFTKCIFYKPHIILYKTRKSPSGIKISPIFPAPQFLYLNENILIRINCSKIFPFALIFAHADQILHSFQGVPGIVADVDGQGWDFVFEGSRGQDTRHPLFVRFWDFVGLKVFFCLREN